MRALDRVKILAGYWYDRFASDGREGLLFGSDYRQLCIKAIQRTLTGQALFGLFSEFPLVGDPFLDLSAYGVSSPDLDDRPSDPVAFDSGDGFGYQPLFEYCRLRSHDSLGFEFDLSKGEPLRPHAVLFPPDNLLQDEVFLGETLRLMGQGDRTPALLDKLRSAPEGWRFAYYGGYNGRPDAPLRIVFRLRGPQVFRYRDNPEALLADLAGFGYPAAGSHMLPALRILLDHTDNCKLSLDLMQDGCFGPTVGCEYGMARRTRTDFLPRGFMEGENAAFLQALEDAGHIDGRWRHAVQSAFAVLSELPEDGVTRRYEQRHGVHTVKLRWRDAAMLPPKMYTQYSCFERTC